jgi:hypothetical protein
VQGVNSQFGLRYDVNYGAPAYTGGFDLHRPTVDLDGFLQGQSNGRVVNCLDCAGLVSKLGAQAGADGHVAVMGWYFDLHWLRGIGWADFTNALFGGNHGFSYHAVVSADGGQTIHDACLSVDADVRPWSPPHTEGLPTGMPWTTYRDQLTPDPISIQDLGRATVR